MLLYGGKSTDRFWNENKPEPFGGEKCVDFFQTDFASDSVSLPRLDTWWVHVRHTGDNGWTFWQHYLCSLIDIIKPREQNSLLSAIEITADSSSDICFARLCFFGSTGKCCTKVLQIVSRSADMTHRGVLQTWKDTDHRRCKNAG